MAGARRRDYRETQENFEGWMDMFTPLDYGEFLDSAKVSKPPKFK